MANRRARIDPLEKAARSVVRSCMRVEHNDRVVVAFDHIGSEVGCTIADAALERTSRVSTRFFPFAQQQLLGKQGSLPGDVECLVGNATVLVTALTQHESCTRFRVLLLEAAKRAGSKIVHMPGVGRELFLQTTAGLDFAAIHRQGSLLRERMSRAKVVQIVTAPDGHPRDRRKMTIELLPKERSSHLCGGIALPGEIMNIPTGEVYVAPREGSATGELVLNGATEDCVFRKRDEPILRFEHGRLQLDCSDFPPFVSSERLRKHLHSSLRSNMDNLLLGELGIGLNRNIKITGETISDEKAYGTAHIAVGTNKPLGGAITADFHDDMVFRPLEMRLDGRLVRIPWAPA